MRKETVLDLPRLFVRLCLCGLLILSVAPTESVLASKSASHSPAKRPNVKAPAQDNVLLQAMNKELVRSFTKLKNAGPEPLYFLSYNVYDSEILSLRAAYGALEHSDHKRSRLLNVETRVGNMELDNTHKLRGDSAAQWERYYLNANSNSYFPLEDDEPAVRTALWLKTDDCFKKAQRDYTQVKANKDVKVREEDESADFSPTKPVVSISKPGTLNIGAGPWEAALRRLSTIYKAYPDIAGSCVDLQATCERRFIVNSEGTSIATTDSQARIFSTVTATADDGMQLMLFDSVDVLDPKELPDEKTLEARMHQLAESMILLKHSPRGEPYTGPAILRPKLAGVFFHEVLGHRVEGHRQKDEDEGHTFSKKIGQAILPDFISVYDDPTLSVLGNKALMGYYRFDNQGVAAQRVTIVDDGVLKNFLMGRSPVNKFNVSNGHSRSSYALMPVARQANLIVESKKQVSYQKLREMLIEEAKKQGKPYGVIFDEVAGGFALTWAMVPQSFKLLPLKVTRVWTDGRPDELIRGVNLVGTPLASLESIIAAADDTDTFNGVCGAESGWVPVSASSPSLLVRTIELARNWKMQDRPPILPPPIVEKRAEAGKQGKVQ